MFKYSKRISRLIFAAGVAALGFVGCASESDNVSGIDVGDSLTTTDDLRYETSAGENTLNVGGDYGGGGSSEPWDSDWYDQLRPCVVVFDTVYTADGFPIVDARIDCDGEEQEPPTVVVPVEPPDFEIDWEFDWGYCYRQSETADGEMVCSAINDEAEYLDCRENGIYDLMEDCYISKMRLGYCYTKPETAGEDGVCLAVKSEAEYADCQAREMWDPWEGCPIVKMVLSITRWCDYGPFGSKEVGFTGCWAIRNDEEFAQCQAEGVGMYLDNRCTIAAETDAE